MPWAVQTAGIMCCPAQVQLLQREAELAEATSAAEGSSKAWKLEQARLREAADQWRAKALELQAEVSSSSSSCAAASCVRSAQSWGSTRGCSTGVLPLQLEASHNEALTTSKAHSQEVAKMQVRAAKQPPWAVQRCVAHLGL